VIIDLAGGPYAKAGQQVLAMKGRMMLVGSVAGGSYEFDSRFVMSKRLQIRGTVLRARSLAEKILAAEAFAAEVVPLFANGRLRANVDSEFKLSEIGAAHSRLESNRTFGKVVVTME
jgi:NADPH:quinone reductase